jgi:hypothetical protein
LTRPKFSLWSSVNEIEGSDKMAIGIGLEVNGEYPREKKGFFLIYAINEITLAMYN